MSPDLELESKTQNSFQGSEFEHKLMLLLFISFYLILYVCVYIDLGCLCVLLCGWVSATGSNTCLQDEKFQQ